MLFRPLTAPVCLVCCNIPRTKTYTCSLRQQTQSQYMCMRFLSLYIQHSSGSSIPTGVPLRNKFAQTRTPVGCCLSYIRIYHGIYPRDVISRKDILLLYVRQQYNCCTKHARGLFGVWSCLNIHASEGVRYWRGVRLRWCTGRC